MNQSILFDDELQWNESEQSVGFTAQCMGAQIQCAAPKALLEQLTGLLIDDQSAAFRAFELCRFDVEELAEEQIEEEEYDSQGRIVLG